MSHYKLILGIVDHELGSKVLKCAKQAGATGGTIMLARRNVTNRFLCLLAFDYEEKEVVLMAVEEDKVDPIMEVLNKKFISKKSNSGIFMTINIEQFIRTKEDKIKQAKERVSSMYSAIFTIVNRGMGEDVIDAAKKGGARGGTIFNGRGSGVGESEMIFAMPIEPEKEIVLVLTHNDLVEKIINVINEGVGVQQPGNGIIFTLPVEQVYGILPEHI